MQVYSLLDHLNESPYLQRQIKHADDISDHLIMMSYKTVN